jgi:arabinofuranan 3-O-arabinosyltransferase
VQISLPWSDLSRQRERLGSIEFPPWRRTAPYVVAGIAAVLATQTWFEPGRFVAAGDVAPFLRTNLSAELTSVWGHSLSSAGSASFQSLARWPELLVLHIAGIFGASAPTAQRWFFTSITLSAALAAVWFASAFVRSPTARTAAGIIAVFNPFVLQHMPNPLTLWSIAMMGAAGGLVVRAALGRAPTPLWLAGLSLLGAYLAINPPLFAMVAIWTIGLAISASWFLGRGASGRAVSYLVRAAPWTIFLNLWWVLPYAFALKSQGTGYIVQAQTNILGWSWTQVRLSLPNVASLDGHWGWSFPQYFPYSSTIDGSIWGPLRFGLPALAFAAPGFALRDRRRTAAVLGAVALALVFLSKGLHAPLAGVNLLLYRHVPGMWLLRDPLSKLGPMLVLIYATLIAIALEGVRDLLSRSKGIPRAALGVGVAVMLIGAVGFAYPMWTGQVIPDRRPVLPPAHVTVPQGWIALAQTLDRSPERGKALVLPLDDFYQVPTTWGYYGVDQIPRSLLTRPTIQFLPGSYYGELPEFASAVRDVQTALLNGDRAAVPALLRALGVSYVIVRRDLDPSFPGRHFASPDSLASTLTGSAGIRSQGSYGVADLFAFDATAAKQGTDPLIRGGTPLQVSTTNPDDLMFAVGSAPPGTTIVPVLSGGSGQTSEGEGTPALSAALVAGPASTRTRFASARGAVRLVPRLIAPQLLHVSQHAWKGGTNLILDRATTVHIDGRPVLGGTLANIHLRAGENAAAIGSGESLAPLIGNEALLGIGASGPLSVWGAGQALRWHGSWTNVIDCHDYDARTVQQAGLTAVRLGGPVPGVSLTARSHSACVRAHVGQTGPSTPLLLRFEYRSVAGRAARVCLWQSGPDRCAPIPPLDPSPGWHRYRAALPPAPKTTEQALFLYADGDAPGGVTTRTEFRGMEVVPLSRITTRTVRITPPPEQTVTIAAGAHELVTQTRAPASLSPLPFVVSDCHAYDQRSIQQAGLQAVALPNEPAPAIRLSALAHSACASAAVEGFVPGGSYTLDLDYRTLTGLPARVCVWEVGPDRCAPLPPMRASSDWYHLQTSVTPDPGTVALRLFVYADAGALGGSSTIVEYRALRVTSAAPLAIAIFDDSVARSVAPQVSWTRLGASTYQVDVSRADEPFVLSLGESFAPGWALQGLPEGRGGEHVVADGYANGWLIRPGDPFTARITFTPDREMHAARAVSLLTGLAIPFAIVRRRRRGVRRSSDGDDARPSVRSEVPRPRTQRKKRRTGTSLIEAPWGAPWW